MQALEIGQQIGIETHARARTTELQLIAQQEAVVPLQREHPEDTLDVILGDRASRRVARALRARGMAQLVLEHADERPLRAEVVPEIPFGDADLGRDLGDRGTGVAPLVEQVPRRIEDALAGRRAITHGSALRAPEEGEAARRASRIPIPTLPVLTRLFLCIPQVGKPLTAVT